MMLINAMATPPWVSTWQSAVLSALGTPVSIHSLFLLRFQREEHDSLCTPPHPQQGVAMPYMPIEDPAALEHLLQLFLAVHPDHQAAHQRQRDETGKPQAYFFSPALVA